MSVDNSLLHPPMSFSLVWSIIGIALILGVFLIFFLIFYVTRKKQIRTLASLPATAPREVDITELRRKYLSMIDSIVALFNARRIVSSVAHQQLSLTTRLFYAEASGIHAEFLTLSDLKKSKVRKLAETIENYYPNEFDMLERGSVVNAAELARKLINDDEVIERKRQS